MNCYWTVALHLIHPIIQRNPLKIDYVFEIPTYDGTTTAHSGCCHMKCIRSPPCADHVRIKISATKHKCRFVGIDPYEKGF